MDNAVLQSITDLLGRDGVNYVVCLDWYKTTTTSAHDSQELVRAAVGSEVVVENLRTVSKPEVLAEVASSLCYAGDAGAGPGRNALQSPEFRRLLASVIAQVVSASDKSDRIEQFSFKAGHPHYPVFWDFAFLFTGPSEARVFVGSSSD